MTVTQKKIKAMAHTFEKLNYKDYTKGWNSCQGVIKI